MDDDEKKEMKILKMSEQEYFNYERNLQKE